MLDLGSQVEVIGLLLTLYLFLWERSRAGQVFLDRALSDENFLGATGRDAHIFWTDLRRELPLLLVVFFAPAVVGAVFLPPAVEIVISLRLDQTYSPLRTAFVTIEVVWIVEAVLLGRRGWLLIRIARYAQRESAYRWGQDLEWLREHRRKRAQQKKNASTTTDGDAK